MCQILILVPSRNDVDCCCNSERLSTKKLYVTFINNRWDLALWFALYRLLSIASSIHEHALMVLVSMTPCYKQMLLYYVRLRWLAFWVCCRAVDIGYAIHEQLNTWLFKLISIFTFKHRIIKHKQNNISRWIEELGCDWLESSICNPIIQHQLSCVSFVYFLSLSLDFTTQFLDYSHVKHQPFQLLLHI